MQDIFLNHAKPIFMPDATYGVVNSISWNDLRSIGTEAIVTNTLHVFLNFILPQIDGQRITLENFYLTNRFDFKKLTNWSGGLLTDSGGFQAYSFVKHGIGKIEELGVRFKDPRTGTQLLLTPELSIKIQLALRADVITVLDDPLDPDADIYRIKESVGRTTKWAKLCKESAEIYLREINDMNPSLVYSPMINAVIQGGGDFNLRKESFDSLSELNFDSFGWGGWPLDKSGRFLEELAIFNAELVNSYNKNKSKLVANYAMGVGNPDDIAKCMKYGYNLFDCVLPTRNARHGLIYTSLGNGEKSGENFDIFRITSERYKDDETPLVVDSKIPELANTTRKYLRYLFKIKDSNAFRIATMANLEFYNNLINSQLLVSS